MANAPPARDGEAAVLITVRPQRADVLCQRLLATGLIDELVAEEVRGYGRQKGHLERYAGGEYRIDYLPKVRIAGVVRRADLDRVVDLVCSTCRSGHIGDGKIFVLPVDRSQPLA